MISCQVRRRNEMAQRSNPALSKPVLGSSLSRLEFTNGEKSAALPSWSGVNNSKGRIHFAQTNLSLSLFACDKAADHTFRVVLYSPSGNPRD
jgi:hypothetical protein